MKKSNVLFSFHVYFFSLLCFSLLNIHLNAQTTEWVSKGIGAGGGLFVPSISPHNSSEWFVPTDMGAMFHSTNSGATWETINFKQLIATDLSPVQFTSDPDILYAIRGWTNPIPVKSNDGGITWSPLPTDPTGSEAFYIFADDGNADRLILSSYTNVFLSKDGGNTFTEIYSTTDESGVLISGVFWDGNTILIGTNFGVLESTDGGTSFSIISYLTLPSDRGMSSFTAAKQNGTIRLFCVTTDVSSIYAGQTHDGDYWDYKAVYKADYGSGNNWTEISPNIGNNFRFSLIASAKNNINVVYIAGGDTDTEFPIVYKTDDAGNSWSSVFKTNNNENIYTGWNGYQGDENWWFNGYALGLDVALNNPDIAIMTDLGYIHSTNNGGTTWEQDYVDPNDQNPPNQPTPKGRDYHGIGIENTGCWWLTWIDQNNIFASFTDITAIRSSDGGESWNKNYSGLIYADLDQEINTIYMVLKHPINNKLYAATSEIHDMYQETRLRDNPIDNGTGDIRISSDNGASWNVLYNFHHPVVWIAFDPNNPNRMYASVVHSTDGGIYRCDDIETDPNTWVKLTNPPRTEGHPYNIRILNDGTLVVTYSGRIDAATDNFTASSGVFVSTDGGNTWEDRSSSEMLYWTKDIVIDPSDNTQNTWYVCVNSGWGGQANDLGGLYKTTDRGNTWTNIFDDYYIRVESCTINPNNHEEMLVTTYEKGLWHTENLHGSQPEFSLVESYPFKHPMRVFYNPYDAQKIWVTNFGNGIRVGDASGLTNLKNSGDLINKQFELYQNYPNPFNPTTTIKYTLEKTTDVTLKVYDILGEEVTTLVSGKHNAGRYSVNFNGSNLSSGIYYYKLKTDKFTRTRKMILIK